MRTLITGGSGFLGANLARRLIADGWDVHLLLRSSGSWRLEDLSAKAHIHNVDVRNKEHVRKTVESLKPEVVFHLAAFGAYSTQSDIEEMVSTNLLGSVSILDACVAAEVPTFVQAGSSSEYGYKDHPSEESERIEPNSLYAITKAAATHYCQLVARESDMRATTLRFYSVYGPYEEPSRLIPSLLIHGMEGTLPRLVSPHTARDFVYVDDAVDAMLRVASNSGIPPGSVYNVCSGTQTDLMHLVTMIREVFDIDTEPVWSSMEQRSWDTNVWVGSPLLLDEAIDWRIRVSLDQGMRDTISWLRANPARLQFYRDRIQR